VDCIEERDPNKAWNYLVEAQDWVKASTHAKPLERLQQEEYIEKLHQIEKVVFPPQVFNSPSYVIKSVQCSICNEKYGKCPHIAGKAYMGRLCSEIVTDFEISMWRLSVIHLTRKPGFPRYGKMANGRI
jgi:hypothetical protein